MANKSFLCSKKILNFQCLSWKIYGCRRWAGVHHKTSTWGGATNFGYVSNSNLFSQSVKGVSMVGAVLASVRTGCARQGWQDLLKSINNLKSDFPSKQKLEIRGFREDWVETTFSALNQSVLDTSLDMEVICRM